MIGPILRRARKGNSRRIIMEARLPHFSHSPRPAPFSATPRNTNSILGRFFVHLTTCVIVCGAYAVASYLNGKNLAFFFVRSTTDVAACRAYAIRPIDGHTGGRTDRKNAIFSGTRVGRNSIRPIDGHARGRMNLIPTQKSIPRKKRGPIPTRFPIPRLKTNLNPAGFSNPRPKNILNLDA